MCWLLMEAGWPVRPSALPFYNYNYLKIYIIFSNAIENRKNLKYNNIKFPNNKLNFQIRNDIESMI